MADTSAPQPAAFAALLVANIALAFGAWLMRLADTGPVAAGFWRIALAAPVLVVAAVVIEARPGQRARFGRAAIVVAGLTAGLTLAVLLIAALIVPAAGPALHRLLMLPATRPLLLLGVGLSLAALALQHRAAREAKLLWALVAVAGIGFAGDLGSWHLGIVRTTLANATLFGNSTTLFYPIYGFLIVRTLPTRSQALALVLAAIGAALLMGRSYEMSSAHLAGDLLCLLAGILYTAYFICMARARAAIAPVPALALSSLASLAPLLAWAGLLGERVLPHHWAPLVVLALVSQLLGQGMMIYALGRLPPLIVGLALLTQPMVAGIVGWLVYDERLGAVDLIGAALVAVALVLVRRRPPLAPRREALR